MSAETILTPALLGIIEDAARAMVTMTAEVDEEAFARSRLTLPAVRRHARTIVETAANLPAATRARLEHLDWDAWAAVVSEGDKGGAAARAALWFAARSLAPATLLWLATYRKHQPELFSYRV